MHEKCRIKLFSTLLPLLLHDEKRHNIFTVGLLTKSSPVTTTHPSMKCAKPIVHRRKWMEKITTQKEGMMQRSSCFKFPTMQSTPLFHWAKFNSCMLKMFTSAINLCLPILQRWQIKYSKSTLLGSLTKWHLHQQA